MTTKTDFDSLPANTLLTDAQASEFLTVAPKTLAVWRCRGVPRIPFIKLGACVRYRLSDLREFLASCEVR